MNPINETIINNVFNGKLKLKDACNLQDMAEELDHSQFDYNQFIQDYSHDMCTILAFYLHDRFDFKIGAIRAIDQDDESDTDYETVVHQYVYLTDELILDARGIDSEKAMLDYYRETSLFDDEEWDFMIDENYAHEPSNKDLGDYDSEDADAFNSFLNLLGEKLKIKIDKEMDGRVEAEENSLSI